MWNGFYLWINEVIPPELNLYARWPTFSSLHASDQRLQTHPRLARTGYNDSSNRRGELKSKYHRKYDHQRAQCEDPEAIRNWFALVRNTRANYGIPDEEMYNFDETTFQMGVIATAKVITRSERSGHLVVAQPGNRGWVTVIEAVSWSGWALPPMIIFEGKVHQASWYKDCELPPDWTIATSDTGWTNDKL